MPISPAAALPGQDNGSLIGEADLLPRHPVFRARDLEPAREYLSGVLAPHRLTYLTGEHRLNFRHRRARLGLVELNALQFGGDVMVTASHFPDYYLLQFTLAGSCTLTQGGRTYDMRAGSVAVINPCRPFTKSWSPDGRQILIRIDRSLLEREMLAWTGRDPRELIEFDQSQAFAMEKVATLTHAVRMLCDDLRGRIRQASITRSFATASPRRWPQPCLSGCRTIRAGLLRPRSPRSPRPPCAAPSDSSRRMRSRPLD